MSVRPVDPPRHPAHPAQGGNKCFAFGLVGTQREHLFELVNDDDQAAATESVIGQVEGVTAKASFELS